MYGIARANAMTKRIDLSATKLRAYKSCPRLYYLQYVEGLRPAERPEYFETGSNYHSCVERILKGEPYETDGIVGCMASSFEKHLPWREWGVRDVERKFETALTPFCHMTGVIDAVCEDGTPVEHKTTTSAIDGKYINSLAWDDQVSFYLLALTLITGKPVTRVIYTVCQKPTIKQKQNETPEEYLERVKGWYDETKIAAVSVVRSERELIETETEIRQMASEIRKRKHFYRNPSNCRIVGCSYSSICLNYDPEIITGFTRKDAAA
jgi:hypothetical protein